MGEELLIDRVCHSKEETLFSQILNIDEEILSQQKKALTSVDIQEKKISPPQKFYEQGNNEWKKRGEQLLSEGKCAALIVAGGQGSRLGFEGPKGCFPVTVVKKKSLFQFFAEKTHAASEKYDHTLDIAVMSSPQTCAETEFFFSERHFFGLKKGQILFFTQPMWPFLDLEGHLIFHENSLVMGPNGNGAALSSFLESGCVEKWKRKGIKYVNFLQVDNPLGDPFDPELLGFCSEMKCDVAIKAVPRREIDEKVGIIVKREGRVEVIEYAELTQKQRESKDLTLANISSFCFSLDFIERVGKKALPLHFQKKQTPFSKEAWKFEHYIFDVLPFAKKVEVIAYQRQDVFAPLKNFYGEDSIISVQTMLAALDRKVCSALTGMPPPQEGVPFELDTRFYYPTERIKEKWRGRKVEGGYLEA